VNAKPRVSVVVPHYHDLTSLDRCLKALIAQTFPADRFEIVVADNASPGGEAEVARTIAGRARLVVVGERGAGPARNGGVQVASGQILAFTDCDCVPEPEWLAEGLKALEACDFVGGRMTVLVDDPIRLSQAEAFETEFAFDNEAYVTRKGFTVTANLFCSRALFDAVGGFRVGVSEDTEWCERARVAGYRIGYAPAAVVGHPARRTWDELLAKWRRLNVESFNLFAHRPGGRLRWLVKSCALPLSALAHTPRVLTSRKLVSLDQRLAALAALYRLRFWRCGESVRLLWTGASA
jgi:GT2 family glycosyltransferase